MVTRVIQYGLGNTGLEMARQVLQAKGLELVGALDVAPEKVNRDVGELAGLGAATGIRVSADAVKLFQECRADLVLHATTSPVDQMFAEVECAADFGLNIVTICGALFYPWKQYPDHAQRLDQKCRSSGVTAVGTGLNPGFVMDAVPLFLGGICRDISRVHCSRCTDFSPYGPAIHRNFGIGLPGAASFEQSVKDGRLPMHRGLTQSMDLIADILGWTLDRKTQDASPLLTRRQRKTAYVAIEPGAVVGCRQILRGFEDGVERVVLENVCVVEPSPEEDAVEVGERTWIDGDPALTLNIGGEIGAKGTIATAARAVNLIPRVMEADSGYLPITRLGMGMARAGA